MGLGRALGGWPAVFLLFLVTGPAWAAPDAPARLPRAKPTSPAVPANLLETPAKSIFDTPAAPQDLLSPLPGDPLAATGRPRSEPAPGDGELVLEARLGPSSAPLEGGVTWRIFDAVADESGDPPLLATLKGGTNFTRMPFGHYLVHAAYGHAGLVRSINLSRTSQLERFHFDIGGLRLRATVGERALDDPSIVDFDVYREIDGERGTIATNARPGTMLRLNPGTYEVVSRYGDANAVVSAEIEVMSGKLTEAEIKHKGAEVTLKLVEARGGEALANTRWRIVTADGETLREMIGAYASLVLAEGEYMATAQNLGTDYARQFRVRAGEDREIEVLLEDAIVE